MSYLCQYVNWLILIAGKLLFADSVLVLYHLHTPCLPVPVDSLHMRPNQKLVDLSLHSFTTLNSPFKKGLHVLENLCEYLVQGLVLEKMTSTQ